MAAAFVDRSTWHWQRMVEVSPKATDEDVDGGHRRDARGRRGRPAPLVRVIHVTEGSRRPDPPRRWHRGAEPESVRRLYAAVADGGFRPRGHLHEIRLADAGRVPRERVRSIIRLPIEPT